MNRLPVLILIVLIVNIGFSQKDTLQLLKGEWYYFGPTQPDVNDTFRLGRDIKHDSYVKWEFRENGSFYEQDITELQESGDSGESAIIMASMVPSTWVFYKEKQTIELEDLSRLYRIASIDSKYLDLVRLK